MIVNAHGSEEDPIVAAVRYDTLEDAELDRAVIRSCCGALVLAIVEAVKDQHTGVLADFVATARSVSA